MSVFKDKATEVTANPDGTDSCNLRIKILEIIDNPDGSAKVIFDVDDEFQKEIMRAQGWDKWQQEEFEQLFINALKEYIEYQKGNTNDGSIQART